MALAVLVGSPVYHVVRNEFDTGSPVLLVEHVLEVRARQRLTRVVAWPAPRVERAA